MAHQPRQSDHLVQFMRLRLRYKALVLSPLFLGVAIALLVSYPLGLAIASGLSVNPDLPLNAQPAGFLVALCFLALFCGVLLAVFLGGYAVIGRHLRKTYTPEASKRFFAALQCPESWYANR